MKYDQYKNTICKNTSSKHDYKHCDSQATARIVEFQLFLAQHRTLELGSVDYNLIYRNSM
jgi:hypothetical protein